MPGVAWWQPRSPLPPECLQRQEEACIWKEATSGEKGAEDKKKYYRRISVIKQTPTDQRAQGKGCELIWQRQAEVVMRAGTKGQGGHLWKVYYLQILCFPLMGNFTTISWGLLQIKTNGDSDSWLRSGYCSLNCSCDKQSVTSTQPRRHPEG